MESSNWDSVTFYKQLEKDCNKSIHAITNCLTFTKAFGVGLDEHLDTILIQRKRLSRYLKRINAPSKQDFITITNRIIDCEERLDNFEETIYCLNKTEESNLLHLKEVKKSLLALLGELETELLYFHQRKITTLEEELEELKQLFDK